MKKHLKKLRDGLLRLLPRRFSVASPVAQLFTRTDGKETRYTFINFPSMFSPADASACRYRVALYDQAGSRVAQKSVDLAALGSIEIQPESFFDCELPEFGMLTAQIQPCPFFSLRGRHLGQLRSHFYAFFGGPRMESMAMIHPQSALVRNSASTTFWESNCLIDPRRVRRIEVFQINPSGQTCDSELRLLDEDGRELAVEPGTLRAHGSRRVSWDLSSWTSSGFLHLALKGMPAPNAKPIVFNYFDDGSFSASHS